MRSGKQVRAAPAFPSRRPPARPGLLPAACLRQECRRCMRACAGGGLHLWQERPSGHGHTAVGREAGQGRVGVNDVACGCSAGEQGR
eukprot:227743-Chlamydomonas_euryale.AAC.1